MEQTAKTEVFDGDPVIPARDVPDGSSVMTDAVLDCELLQNASHNKPLT
jgi:hypothetical protein